MNCHGKLLSVKLNIEKNNKCLINLRMLKVLNFHFVFNSNIVIKCNYFLTKCEIVTHILL